ncbi:hypothetical protein AAFF_G00235590 [Aldrovandia affinis]|uniref:Uncharacterized protein n=1 Tax=Aldrovandia affinis TaxID=143900 RepID=A0AAD7WTY0_9TELE|nr:hypothetical protein AAFF_G00235590 [Aldrovandia affinis]
MFAAKRESSTLENRDANYERIPGSRITWQVAKRPVGRYFSPRGSPENANGGDDTGGLCELPPRGVRQIGGLGQSLDPRGVASKNIPVCGGGGKAPVTRASSGPRPRSCFSRAPKGWTDWAGGNLGGRASGALRRS